MCGSGPLSLLVADARDGHGLPPGAHLYPADHETTEIAEIWVDAKRGRHLEHDCRWVVFRHRADDHGVWRIACHGACALHRDRQRRRAVFRRRRGRHRAARHEIRHAPRRLAILLACESLLTSSSLPNETLGLPSALLQLGFAGVIATDRRRDVRADRSVQRKPCGQCASPLGHRITPPAPACGRKQATATYCLVVRSQLRPSCTTSSRSARSVASVLATLLRQTWFPSGTAGRSASRPTSSRTSRSSRT